MNNTMMWWEFEEGSERVAVELHKLIKQLDANTTGIQQNNLRNMRLYNNQEITGLSMAQYVLSQTAPTTNITQNRISLNVVKSCVDTLVAKISKNKIQPKFLTSNGSFEMQDRAQKLEKFITGLFYQGDIPHVGQRVLKDTCIFGTGATKVYTNEDKQVVADKVFPDEILVDPNEAYYGKPRTMYQRMFASKSTLLDLYKDDKVKYDQILKTPIVNISMPNGYADCVLLVEGWRLPSKKGAKDGRHVVALENCLLSDKEWKRTRFPFAFMRYTELPLGFFGCGMAEELTGIQIEINRLLIHIQNSMKLVSNPRTFIENGSQVNKNQLTNQIGGIVYYSGVPPTIQAAQSVHPELFSQLENLYRKAFEIIGISQLSAMSKNPLGANASGKALREYNDIETERFVMTGRAYEDWHIELAELMIEEVKEIPGYEVKAFSRTEGMEKIKWSEIDFDEDSFVMQIFPASALPQQPSARLQTVQEMMQAQLINPQMGQELLDFPDLDKHNALVNSPVRLLKKIIEQIIREEEYKAPEPYMNLEEGIAMAQNYYNYGLLTNMKESKLELLRMFMEDCKALLAPLQPPAPAPMPMPEQGMEQPPMPMPPAM